MTRFNRGETIELRLWNRDPDTNELFTPSNVPTVVVTDPDGVEFQASDTMTFVSTGYYIYKLLTAADDPIGTYQVKYTTIDSSATSIKWDSFDLGR